MPGQYDYVAGREIAAQRPPFFALIQAAAHGADTQNLARLRAAFPAELAEMDLRGTVAFLVDPDSDAIAAVRAAAEVAAEVAAHGALTTGALTAGTRP